MNHQPVTDRNEFFNPDDYDTHVLGFVEELVVETGTAFGWKCIGTRRLLGLPDRPLGSPGTKMVTITETVTLQSGHKTKIYRASKDRPLKCQATLQPICGRDKK